MFINPASLGSCCSIAEINDEVSDATSAYVALCTIHESTTEHWPSYVLTDHIPRAGPSRSAARRQRAARASGVHRLTTPGSPAPQTLRGRRAQRPTSPQISFTQTLARKKTTYAAIDQQTLLSRRKPQRSRNKPAALDILLILHLPELRPAQHFLEPALRRDHDLPTMLSTRCVVGAEDLEKAAGGDPLEKPIDDQLCEEGGYLGVSEGLGGPRGGVVYE